MSTLKPEMDALFAEAEARGLWFWSRYQDLWFSPKQLRAAQAEGRFRWGPVNWELHHPSERLNRALERARAAEADVERIRKEIADV